MTTLSGSWKANSLMSTTSLPSKGASSSSVNCSKLVRRASTPRGVSDRPTTRRSRPCRSPSVCCIEVSSKRTNSSNASSASSVIVAFISSIRESDEGPAAQATGVA